MNDYVNCEASGASDSHSSRSNVSSLTRDYRLVIGYIK